MRSQIEQFFQVSIDSRNPKATRTSYSYEKRKVESIAKDEVKALAKYVESLK